jgi:hypothetical protein
MDNEPIQHGCRLQIEWDNVFNNHACSGMSIYIFQEKNEIYSFC